MPLDGDADVCPVCRDGDDGKAVKQACRVVELVESSLCSFDQCFEIVVVIVVQGVRETLREVAKVGGEADGVWVISKGEGGEDVCGCCVNDGGFAEGLGMAGCDEKVFVVAGR